ncbi:hypothetical protein [Paenibacillus sp. 1011MAR3C5]|nr:hypothetical protein [Paenibacillus sp. 1011MAR3C5]
MAAILSAEDDERIHELIIKHIQLCGFQAVEADKEYSLLILTEKGRQG